jgi:hypothetical protein
VEQRGTQADLIENPHRELHTVHERHRDMVGVDSAELRIGVDVDSEPVGVDIVTHRLGDGKRVVAEVTAIAGDHHHSGLVGHGWWGIRDG